MLQESAKSARLEKEGRELDPKKVYIDIPDGRSVVR